MPFPQVEEVNRAKSIPVSLRESVLPIHRPPAGVAKTETKIRQDVEKCEVDIGGRGQNRKV